MKTSTAEEEGYVCPKCGQRLSQDLSGKGFVRHLSKNGKDYCDYEPPGSKDETTVFPEHTPDAL